MRQVENVLIEQGKATSQFIMVTIKTNCISYSINIVTTNYFQNILLDTIIKTALNQVYERKVTEKKVENGIEFM